MLQHMKLRRGWLALITGAVVLVWLLWMVWPSAQPGTPSAAREARARQLTPPPPEEEAAPPAPPPTEADVLAALGIDKATTPLCAQIWVWTSRRVPGWVITDNIEAQAMLFDERELACLTGTPRPRPDWIPPLPGGILPMAENRPRYPQPPRGP